MTQIPQANPSKQTPVVPFGRIPASILRSGLMRSATRSEWAACLAIAVHVGRDWSARLSIARLADLTGLTTRSELARRPGVTARLVRTMHALAGERGMRAGFIVNELRQRSAQFSLRARRAPTGPAPPSALEQARARHQAEQLDRKRVDALIDSLSPQALQEVFAQVLADPAVAHKDRLAGADPATHPYAKWLIYERLRGEDDSRPCMDVQSVENNSPPALIATQSG